MSQLGNGRSRGDPGEINGRCNQDAVGPAHRGLTPQRPLCFAARGGHTQCLQLLLAARANGNLLDKTVGTAIHAAAHPEGAACVQLLLAAKCQWNQDVELRTPLYLAAATGALEVMDLLLAAKASPWIPNRRRQTPLHVLREAGGVEKLLRARAEVLLVKLGFSVRFMKRSRVCLAAGGQAACLPNATAEVDRRDLVNVVAEEAYAIGLWETGDYAAARLTTAVVQIVLQEGPTDDPD
eukprot:s36_g42.t1